MSSTGERGIALSERGQYGHLRWSYAFSFDPTLYPIVQISNRLLIIVDRDHLCLDSRWCLSPGLNGAIDDVNVQKQEALRPGGRKPERGQRNYVHYTIADIV